MEAIRKIETVKDNTLKVTLPDHYNDTEVELIILPVEKKAGYSVEESKPNYKSLFGTLNSGLSIEEIDAQLKSLRN